MTEETPIIIYTDGGWRGNPRPGGCGGVLQAGKQRAERLRRCRVGTVWAGKRGVVLAWQARQRAAITGRTSASVGAGALPGVAGAEGVGASQINTPSNSAPPTSG